jgi:DNA modification methylase
MLTIIQGDALIELRKLPSESVHCCVTSPPYWGLRDYGTANWEGGDDSCDHLNHASVPKGTADSHSPDQQSRLGMLKPYAHACGKCGAKRLDAQLGLEKTPAEYVAKMVEIFREVRRVLRKDGTLWLNLGDSYCNAGSSRNGEGLDGKQRGGAKGEELGYQKRDPRYALRKQGIKHKDLIGIPWRVAFALQADGWYLRSDIIWAKPNPMPESVTDRCTKAHEYVFLLTKSANYFYDADAIKEKGCDEPGTHRGGSLVKAAKNGIEDELISQRCHRGKFETLLSTGNRNKRSVWTVATAPYPEAHFATYPPDLIKPCILAGTSAKGCCERCGAPWERILDGATYYDGKQVGSDRQRKYGFREYGRGPENNLGHSIQKTLGWQPTCECLQFSDVHACDEPDKESVETPNGAQAREKSRGVRTHSCTVLDPFAGSGTTGAVALELGRKAILIELNPKYIPLIEERCDVTMGLALA